MYFYPKHIFKKLRIYVNWKDIKEVVQKEWPAITKLEH